MNKKIIIGAREANWLLNTERAIREIKKFYFGKIEFKKLLQKGIKF